MIDRNLIRRLSQVSKEWCVSIYVPKQQKDKKYELDQLRFNSALAEVLEHLQHRGLKKAEADDFVRPLESLPDRDYFYNRYQPGVLAIFFSSDILEVVEIPTVDEQLIYVGNEFYLRPVLSLLNGMERFFLVTLESDRILLYEGTENSIIQGANLTDLTANGREQAGENDLENKEELYLKKYFRRIDEKLNELLEGEKSPLLLCASEKSGRIYQEVSSYPKILPRYVEPHPEPDDLDELMRRVHPVFQEFLREEKRAKRRFFVQEMLKGNASISLTDILAAAVDGKVAKLFLDKDEYTTGEYKPAIKYAKVDEEPTEDRTALFNLAAIKTFQKGGEVYNFEREALPDSTTTINATFWAS
jgi:hypothetical protein